MYCIVEVKLKGTGMDCSPLISKLRKIGYYLKNFFLVVILLKFFYNIHHWYNDLLYM